MKQEPQLLPAQVEKGGPVATVRKAQGRIADALAPEREIETSFEAPKRFGLIVAFLVFGVFGLWSIAAPLEGYAHAPGFVTVMSYKKLVQHYEGGIVKELRVRNGDVVKEGDVMLVLDSTQTLAQLEIAQAQLLARLALEARLTAERDGAETISWPDELPEIGRGASERRSQQQVFAARKATHEGAIAVLEQRIDQLESRVEGLKAMRASKSVLANSFDDELKDARTLLERGFENKLRLRDLERNHAQATGEVAELDATIAATEIQIGETRLQILQLQNEFQREVANELAAAQVESQNAHERVIALRDVVARAEVRAPTSGTVNDLQVHTIGGVIGPGSPIAEVVPESDDLVIEARIATIDIDRGAEGQDAMVRMSAFNSKSVPTLYGTVIGISADSMTDQATRVPYYSARIALKPESLEALEGMELVPGMPAEAFISTGSRTFLQYLMKPLSNAMARSFRED